MAKKNNMSKGLGPFSRLDEFDAAVMRAPRQAPPSKATTPKRSKIVDTTHGIGRDLGIRAVSGGKIRKYYG